MHLRSSKCRTAKTSTDGHVTEWSALLRERTWQLLMSLHAGTKNEKYLVANANVIGEIAVDGDYLPPLSKPGSRFVLGVTVTN